MSKRPPLKRDLGKKLLITGSVVIFVVALVVFLAYALTPSDVIADDVYVNSLSVGGLTTDEATEKITQNYNEEYFNKTVAVNYNNSTLQLNIKDAVSVNASETAQDALKHSGNFFTRLFRKGNVVVPFVVETNSDAVRGKVSEFFMEAEKNFGIFVFDEKYTTATVDATKLEKVIDVDGTLGLIYENAKNDKYDGVDALTFKKGDEKFAESIYYYLVRKPVNATVGADEDNSTYLIPEVVGIDASKEEFLKLYAENDGRFSIDVKATFPEITANDLNIDFYQDVLGAYTSSYDEGLVNRTKNVKLATSLIDGTIIMPGENFSYNRVVGK